MNYEICGIYCATASSKKTTNGFNAEIASAISLAVALS